MISIKDVAKRAGVAISTVSKVLNGYPGVSEETKKKVHEAIRDLNFVPNSIAAALSSKKTGRIALLLNMKGKNSAIQEINMQYLSGGIHKAQELRLDLITVFSSMLREKTIDEIIQYFKAQNIEGIIIYGLTNEENVLWELVKSNMFKMVLVDVPFVNEHTSSVGIDHKTAQKEVAKRTIGENASEKILYIAGDKNSYASMQRLEGMEELAKEMNCQLFVQHGDFSELKARNITFQYAKKMDVIICSSDLMAIGAMRSLIEMDIFRPVCGFDGLNLMGYAGKQMNTIKQYFAEVSAEAVQEMSYLLQGKKGGRVITGHTIERMKYLDIIC